MLKILLLASGKGNEVFHFPLQSTKLKLEEALLEKGFMKKGEPSSYMSKKGLSYNRDICSQARDLYRTQLNCKECPPCKEYQGLQSTSCPLC